MRIFFRAFTDPSIIWWKAEAFVWGLLELREHFRGKVWCRTLLSLSGTFWSIGGYEVYADGTAGPGYSVFWYDPPSGPP